MNKYGYSEKEVGHMTLKKWSLLWKAYAKNFDNELYLKAMKKTYEEAAKPKDIDDIIPYQGGEN